MQRTLLITLAAVVVAAGIATTATIVLTGDDEENAALPSPSATAVTTAEATASVETATPGPTATDDDFGSDPEDPSDPTATPTRATTKPGVTVRSAKDVDCDEDPQFCSTTDAMEVSDDSLDKPISERPDPESSSRPTVKMESEVWDPDKNDASAGEEVGSIHVEVVVKNSSKDTFVFAEREIVLDLYRNGELYDSFATKGDGFEMTPGSSMNGKFDRPITEDGSYTWRAKVWYYEK